MLITLITRSSHELTENASSDLVATYINQLLDALDLDLNFTIFISDNFESVYLSTTTDK